MKPHAIALVLGILVGIIMSIPHIIIPLQTHSRASYIPFLRGAITGNTEDEVFGMANIQRAVQNQFPPTEVHIYEHRNTPSPREILPYIVLGWVARLLGSIYRMVVLCDFLFPLIQILFFYGLLWILTRQRLISAVGSILCFFGNDLILYFPPRSHEEWAVWIRNLTDYVASNPIYFGALPNPGFSFLILFSALLFFYLSLVQNHRVYIGAQGIFSGLLFYTYFYYGPFYFAGTGVFFIFALLNRNKGWVNKIAWGWLIAAMVSIPYWGMVLQARQLPFWQELGERYGVFHIRTLFKFTTIKYLSFLAFFVFMARKHLKECLYFTAFLVGGIVCLNMQVITGWTIEPDHWESRVLNPWVLMMVSYLLGLGYKKCEQSLSGNHLRFVRAMILGMAGMLLIWAINILVSFSQDARFSIPKFQQMQPHMEAMTWLDTHSASGDVVLTIDPELVPLIPIYTKLYNFLPHASPTTTPFAEMEDRMMRAYKFLGVSPEQIDDWMRNSHYAASRFEYYEKYVRPYSNKDVLKEIYVEDSWIRVFWHQRYYFNPECPMTNRYSHSPEALQAIRSGKSYRYVPASERTRMLEIYKSVGAEAQDLTGRYKCNFIYLGPYEKKVMQKRLDQDSRLKKVFSNGVVDLYKFT